MTDQHDTTGLLLGEIRGQMRELIYNLNNATAKIDVLTEKVIATAALPGRIEKLEERVTALEADRNRRDGAMSFGGWVIRSPLVGWLAGAGLALWMLLKGKP